MSIYRKLASTAAAFLLAAITACGSSGGSGVKLYAADGSYATGGFLYSLDPDTGTIDIVGPIVDASGFTYPVTALAMGPDGMLYASVTSYTQNSENEDTFLQIDPQTGEATQVDLDDEDACFDGVADFVAMDGALYGAASDTTCFMKIDFDGTVTAVETEFTDIYGGAIAELDGTVHFIYDEEINDTTTLATIDLEDGAITDGDIEIEDPTDEIETETGLDMAYTYAKAMVNYNGRLLAIVGSYYEGNVLVEIDPETGDTTFVMVLPQMADALAVAN